MPEITAPTVTLDKHGEVTLVEPSSLFSLAVGRTEEQAKSEDFACLLARGAASLRMCWPEKRSWPAKPRGKDWRPGMNVVLYGAEVWESLRKATRGTVKLSDLTKAAVDAYNWAALSALTEEEVSEAEDFSGGQEEE